jgi:hypothetical protein
VSLTPLVNIRMKLTELNHLDGAVFKYDGDDIRPVAIPYAAWEQHDRPVQIKVRIEAEVCEACL